MNTRLARIVPNDPDSPVARGVKVIQADGSTIRGIKKLTLVAESGSHLWTAKIEMNVLPPAGLTAQYETTDITSEEREFEADHRLPPEVCSRLAEIYWRMGEERLRANEEAVAKHIAAIADIYRDIQKSDLRNSRNYRP